MTVEIEDIDLGFNDFFDTAKKLESMDVDVGYTQSAGGHGGIGLADLAIIQEFGTKITVTDKMRGFLASQGLFLKKSTKVITIPPRPSIRNSFDNNTQEIGDEGIKLAAKYFEGKIDVELLYEVWGDFYKQILKDGITSKSLGLAENHPFTIERKGSGTPLVNTARLINGSQVIVNSK